jgi:glutamine amidotransferase
VVVASEQMDEDAGWRPLEPGELVHVDAELKVVSTHLEEAPAHRLTLKDLNPDAAASQSTPPRG